MKADPKKTRRVMKLALLDAGFPVDRVRKDPQASRKARDLTAPRVWRGFYRPWLLVSNDTVIPAKAGIPW